jgi:hypothetical protein
VIGKAITASIKAAGSPNVIDSNYQHLQFCLKICAFADNQHQTLFSSAIPLPAAILLLNGNTNS